MTGEETPLRTCRNSGCDDPAWVAIELNGEKAWFCNMHSVMATMLKGGSSD